MDNQEQEEMGEIQDHQDHPGMQDLTEMTDLLAKQASPAHLALQEEAHQAPKDPRDLPDRLEKQDHPEEEIADHNQDHQDQPALPDKKAPTDKMETQDQMEMMERKEAILNIVPAQLEEATLMLLVETNNNLIAKEFKVANKTKDIVVAQFNVKLPLFDVQQFVVLLFNVAESRHKLLYVN